MAANQEEDPSCVNTHLLSEPLQMYVQQGNVQLHFSKHVLSGPQRKPCWVLPGLPGPTAILGSLFSSLFFTFNWSPYTCVWKAGA